jgi:hypothetical protein
MNNPKKITAAKLLSLDRLCSELIDNDNYRDALTDRQARSISFALDFVPSVFSWWIDKKREASPKQLNKIEEMYDLFECGDYEEFLEDERIKDI